MKLIDRIQRAYIQDPLLNLARELYEEGYNEALLITEINREKLEGHRISDIALLKIKNHLREICKYNEIYKGDD